MPARCYLDHAKSRSDAGDLDVAEVQLDGVPTALIECLADAYPDVSSARAVWCRAGGAGREVPNNPRPFDLWQRLWQMSRQGATARPIALLRAAHSDLPHNPVIKRYLSALETNA